MTLVGLLRWDLRAARRGARAPGERLVLAALVAGGAALFAGEWAIAAFVLRKIDTAGAVLPDVAERLLLALVASLFRILLPLLATSNMVSALGMLFRAPDLDLPLASPLPRRTLLVHRLLRSGTAATLPTLLLVVPLLLPVALSGVAVRPGALLALALALLLAAASCSLLGAAGTVLLVRFAPRGLAPKLIAGAGVSVVVIAAVLARAARPERFLSPLGDADLSQLATELEPAHGPIAPARWLAEIATAPRTGAETLLPLLFLLALALAVATPAAFAVAKLWRRALSRSRDSEAPAGARVPFRKPPSRWLRLRGPAAALLDRELRFVVRDPSKWSQIAVLGGLAAVYVANLEAFAAADPLSRLALVYVNLATVGFIVLSFALRFAFPAISSEGEGLVVIRTAPVRPALVLAVKLAVVAVPITLLGLALTAAANVRLGMPPELASLALLSTATLGLSLPALAVGLGAAFPRLEAADGAEAALSAPGVVTTLLGLVAIVATTLLACRPLQRAILGWVGFAERWWEPWVVAAAILALGAATALPALRLGARALLREARG